MSDEGSVVADILEQAVAKLNAVLDTVTPGPWWHDENEQSWSLHGQAWPAGPGMQILKAPKAHPRLAPYWPEAGDAGWITMMDPVLGKALGSWLAKVADDARENAGRLREAMAGPDSGWLVAEQERMNGLALASAYHHPLQVARLILGEHGDLAP